ncbi:hypothetical protein C8A03DRAFT_16513 [Achaetomium macrosporum]|uniref:Uncharacterized protein n=1 Tax=Achaetomium macrosporum TaxID=79813 RepID=A0AAN7C8I2_9PEZI|nr:hypothetical protein C8A03DRAFT_16513 [Achaetomium macrosporum]
MKPSTLAVLYSILVAAAAQGTTNDTVAWYDPVRNATCTGNPDDGRIRCQAGQVEALLMPPDSNIVYLHTLPVVAIGRRGTSPDEDGDDDGDKPRAADEPGVCIGEGRSKNVGCFLHCFAQGFCTAQCDGEKVPARAAAQIRRRKVCRVRIWRAVASLVIFK